MKALHAYLTFNGNCREAMIFYKQCLGGELLLQPVGESPMADKLPAKMKECILHAVLTTPGGVLMGSDMVGENGLIRGNSVSLCLHCNSEEAVRTSYAKLSEGGQATHPLENSFWGALFGDLTDKYGNLWLLHYDKNQKQ